MKKLTFTRQMYSYTDKAIKLPGYLPEVWVPRVWVKNDIDVDNPPFEVTAEVPDWWIEKVLNKSHKI